MKQTTNNIMMIEPVLFNYNSETAVNNYYQSNDLTLSNEKVQQKARDEFSEFVSLLRSKGVNVFVFKDTIEPHTPDSIFPNNWISLHQNGEVFLFPMFAKNRRAERRLDIISKLKNNFNVTKINSLTYYENQNIYLEGTGSMIFDRVNKICYAARSLRTNEIVLEDFCSQIKYKLVVFSAFQDANNKRLEIYHTNVMMCVANNYAVVCLDSIDSNTERLNVVNSLSKTKKEIIEISEYQANQFAGNMLQVTGDQDYLVMSKTAYDSLNKSQIEQITSFNDIIYANLDIIEKCGGGSARCMMAEIFLPLKDD
jgi:hypothetical protein